MSEYHSIDPSCDLESQIQNKVEEAKAGKREVSDFQFGSLCCVLLVIVGCLALQNAMYGYSQGGTISAMALLGVLYFSGDVALATLMSLETRKTTAVVLTGLVKVGLVLLSLVSGIAFMLSQQATTDRADSRLDSLQQQIAINQEAFQQYHKTVTADRLVVLNEQLEAERKRLGADHASTNALYVYLAKLTGHSFEAVSFIVRGCWIALFILTGMSLSALLSLLWCPFKEQRAFSRALRGQVKALRRAQAIRALEGKYEALRTIPRTHLSTARKTRAATQDTGTKEHAYRYEDVRNSVLSGRIKPSVSAVRRNYGCGTETARGYLKELAGEGVLRLEKNGYTLVGH